MIFLVWFLSNNKFILNKIIPIENEFDLEILILFNYLRLSNFNNSGDI